MCQATMMPLEECIRQQAGSYGRHSPTDTSFAAEPVYARVPVDTSFAADSAYARVPVDTSFAADPAYARVPR
jgi:hypothetical protein